MSEALNEKIDNYLKGTLSETDLRAFEADINADESLAKAVAVFKLEKEAIELLIEADLRAKTRLWKSEKTTKKPPSFWSFSKNTEGVSFLKKNYFYLILSVLIALILIVFLYLMTVKKALNTPFDTLKHKELPVDTMEKEQKTNPQIVVDSMGKTPIKTDNKIQKPIVNTPKTVIKKEDNYVVLAHSIYDNPDFSETNRDINTVIDSTRLDAFKNLINAWRNDDFKQVIALSESIKPNDINYFSSQEITAHAYFKLNQFVNAETLFRVISQSKKGGMSENAQFYSLLCLIALHKNDAATTLLNTLLINEKHIRHAEAKRLNPLWERTTIDNLDK